jgi:uncharacterized cupin superfamily protein
MVEDEIPSGSISGDPKMRFAELVGRKDLKVGVWSCTPCKWVIDFHEENEVMLLLSGRLRITDADGSAKELVKGDVFFIPRGWSGQWETLETMEKLYVIVDWKTS